MKKFRMAPIRSDNITDILEIAIECGLSSWSESDYMDEAGRDDSIMLRLETETCETIGFLIGRRVISSTVENRYDAEIYNIGVKESFQKNGCGTMLLAKFLEESRRTSVRDVWLDVRRSNENAIRFYEKNGFKIYTIRKNFYSAPGEDGMVMRLKL